MHFGKQRQADTQKCRNNKNRIKYIWLAVYKIIDVDGRKGNEIGKRIGIGIEIGPKRTHEMGKRFWGDGEKEAR